jgi:hypothetical protein
MEGLARIIRKRTVRVKVRGEGDWKGLRVNWKLNLVIHFLAIVCLVSELLTI